MSFVERILGELRDKRLWPLALVLLAALVAVPILLSKSASAPPPVADAPAANQTAPPAALAVVSSASSPSVGKLRGSARNPFNQLVHGATTSVASAVNALTATPAKAGASGGTSTTQTSGASSTATGTGSSSTSTTTTTTTTTTIPTGTPKPAPPGLKANQSYDVKLAITNSSGGVDTLDSLERLSVLPSKAQPLLVELGVLKGGNRVLFAVQPDAAVSGAGTCIPGPIDCEVLSLPQDQTVTLGARSSSGIRTVALFAVTGIRAVDHSSVAAAKTARQAASPAGRAVLNASSAAAMSLFQYDPGLGAVVDLRNLTVGG
jgi:hypothetical protein